jgi:short-subunit dehydrogenase
VEETVKKLGKIDCLVNNVGCCKYKFHAKYVKRISPSFILDKTIHYLSGKLKKYHA